MVVVTSTLEEFIEDCMASYLRRPQSYIFAVVKTSVILHEIRHFLHFEQSRESNVE
jgi:hypothetical protein